MIQLALQALAILFGMATLLGLYRPWLVFWWSDFSNRKKVLKHYGIITMLLIIMLLLL